MKTKEMQPDCSSYTSEAELCEMTRYYQTLPIGAFYDSNLIKQGHNPMSKSSRTPFKSTGPVQVGKTVCYNICRYKLQTYYVYK